MTRTNTHPDAMKEKTMGRLLTAALAAAGSLIAATAPAQQIRDNNQPESRFGWAVAAGDVNKDGRADVVVGAPAYDNGQDKEGQVALFLGTSTGLASTAAWTYESNQAGASLGFAVATGDLNGDDYADVIVGVPDWDNGQTDEGRVLVFFGAAGGPPSSPSWSYEPNQAGAHLGLAVGSSAKVDNDKYAELLVGVPDWDNGQTDEGRVLAFFGASTLPSTPTWSYELNQAGARLGTCVATAGDVNGDGKTDVVAGAEEYDSGSLKDAGRIVVFHGSNSGLPSTPNWTKDGDAAYAYLGIASAAGDVNGDNRGELLASSWAYMSGEYWAGRTYVYHGSSSGLASSPARTYVSAQSDDSFGHAVATAGHFNADAYADIVIGSPLRDVSAAEEGVAAIYVGSSSGLGAAPTLTLSSAQAAAQLGHSACSGDVNADGKDDVISGAPWYSNGQSREGAIFCRLGP